MRSSAATDATHSRPRQVLDLVREEQQLLEQLTGLALEVRRALVHMDAYTLETLAGRQERLLKQLLALEGQRQGFVTDERSGAAEAANGTARSEEEHTLLAACEVLRAQMREFQSVNAINRRLLAGIARWSAGLVDAFRTHFEQVAPYDVHGSRPVSLQSHLLIDRQV